MRTSRQMVFWAVSFGHMMNDLFMSMGPVLLVFISANLIPVTPAIIGLTVSMQQVMGAVSQPVFGWMADARGGRWLGAGGVAWTVSFLCIALMFSLQGNYLLMAIPFTLAALGSGAFHPVGVLYAGADEKNANSNTAIFFLFGQLGLAMGPALAGIFLTATLIMVDGVEQSGITLFTFLPIFFVALFGIPAAFMMAWSIPNSRITRANKEKAKNDAPPVERVPFLTRLYRAMSVPVAIFIVLVALRSAAQLGIASFIPVLFESKGWTSAEYGIILSVFWISVAVLGVVLGKLADRYDTRLVIALSILLSVPALFLLPTSDGVLAYVLVGFGGGFLGASHSLLVIMAQRIIPLGKGLISGMILGFIFVTGAIGTSLFGVTAEQIGLEPTFYIAAFVAAISGAMVFLLPAWVSNHRRLTIAELKEAEILTI